jgi:hypothetical protein
MRLLSAIRLLSADGRAMGHHDHFNASIPVVAVGDPRAHSSDPRALSRLESKEVTR